MKILNKTGTANTNHPHGKTTVFGKSITVTQTLSQRLKRKIRNVLQAPDYGPPSK
jgi:hypothetical protein